MPNKTQTVINQFAINDIVDVPCDGIFENLLPQTCIIERPYDSSEGVKRTNEYGEVVMIHSQSQVVGTDIKTRLENISQRGKTGFGIEIQGGEVRATYRLFLCPEVDVKDNDVIIVGTRKFQVLLVSRFYDYNSLHHLELLSRRTDNL